MDNATIEKVFITSNQTANFKCPACHKIHQMDVSKFASMNQAIRIKAKCACGETTSVFLERRRHVRKAVDLPGTFVQFKQDRPVARGVLRIKDLSRYGLKLQFNSEPGLSQGDKLKVEFNLDDAKHSPISKDVVVRKVRNTEVGVEFESVDASSPSDSALGFYLMG